MTFVLFFYDKFSQWFKKSLNLSQLSRVNLHSKIFLKMYLLELAIPFEKKLVEKGFRELISNQEVGLPKLKGY